MNEVYRAWRRFMARPLLADSVLALVLLAGSVSSATVFPFDEAGSRPLDAYGVLLMVAGAAPLALRRRYPTAVLLVTTTAMFGYYTTSYPDGGQIVPAIVALYSVAAHGSRVVAYLVGAAAALFGPVTLMLRSDLEFDFWRDLGMAGWVLSTLVLGEFSRARRSYLEELQARLELVERTREDEARRRAGEERLRIARELHDVLAHNISMINVQAGVAVHLLDDKPEQARAALVTIKNASKDALQEVRGALGMLRQVDGGKPRDGAPLAPTPSLERLEGLVEHAAAAGVQVRLAVDGVPPGRTPPKLAAGTELAAYRIVQEALTNVIRHAGPATATVTLAYQGADLVLEVTDDGRGQPATVPAGAGGGGNGIVGMRERAAAAGGELTAGPRPEGGFRVHARLPLRGAA